MNNGLFFTLTDTTNQQADQLINGLMNGFAIDWRNVK